MKSSLLPILLSGLLIGMVATAHADLTMVQEAQYGQQIYQVTVKLKGDKMRVDGMPMNYMVMDINSGDTYVVMPQQKIFVKTAGASVAEAVAKMGGQEQLGDNKFVATGETEKVGGYDTEIYTVQTPRLKGKYWVAKDYPHYEQIKEEVRKLNTGLMTNAAKGRVPDISDLPGVPVKTEIQVLQPMPMTVQTTLISTSQDPISDDTFVIPQDYRQMQVPESSIIR